jgi:hypothetical protein
LTFPVKDGDLRTAMQATAAAQSWGPRKVLRKMTEEEAIALQSPPPAPMIEHDPPAGTSYALGLLCECGARRPDNGAWRAAAATSPWKEPDGVLARVRGDAAVVREIIFLKGL